MYKNSIPILNDLGCDLNYFLLNNGQKINLDN